mmetsp:Transcript_308/g.584  ORF Transcript_308/g.584 Transcript_308/m.584 type:complete len:131 (-) Transcript_308:285-677(-)
MAQLKDATLRTAAAPWWQLKLLCAHEPNPAMEQQAQLALGCFGATAYSSAQVGSSSRPDGTVEQLVHARHQPLGTCAQMRSSLLICQHACAEGAYCLARGGAAHGGRTEGVQRVRGQFRADANAPLRLAR